MSGENTQEENPNVTQYLERMEIMMHNPKYDFALGTVEGIKGWVEDHNHITAKQMTAIDNIWAGAHN